MNIWRLIAHHEQPTDAIKEMTRRNRIAVGWSRIGDLASSEIKGSTDISRLIKREYKDLSNAQLGGPSLWNLFSRVRTGDLVLLNAESRRKCVFEVTGPYIFEPGDGQILGYAHQRPACLTSIDPDLLWRETGSSVAKGENVRWTLAACTATYESQSLVFMEGTRYSVTSSAYERNPFARRICIEHYGCKCFVCGFDFERVYGGLGAGFIHVHHKIELSRRREVYAVDPIKDLIPLCANCHAMAHQRQPAVPVEELRTRIRLDDLIPVSKQSE